MPFGLTNAPAIFMDLVNRVCKPYLDKFVIVFIDGILIYSKNKQEHEEHLKLILELLKKEELYAKISKCKFWILKVQFLGYVIDNKGIHVDPAKIESIKDWASLKTPTEIRTENFIVYCDASHKGLGVVLMQNEKVIAYVSRQVKIHEKNYTTHDLELGEVVNDASGSGLARGQDATHAVRECTFTGFMNCNPVVFHGVEGAIKLRRWFEKTRSVFKISDCVEGKKVKFAAATLEGPALTWAMEKLFEKLGNTEDKVECKKLKKELEEARGFVFEERSNEAINVLIKDEKSLVSDSRGSPPDL
nr:putative reverse transcriptase domain-containing protein [Tanacetum cinerariifolium]